MTAGASRAGARRASCSGTVSADPSGLWAVKIRLARRVGQRCWYFCGKRERFLSARCGSATRSRSAMRRPGATCSRRGCRAAATCSTLTRSTTRSTAARSETVGSGSDEAGARRRARRCAARGAAGADAARVQVMVVGRITCCARRSTVKLKPRSVKVGGKRCRVAAATPLAVLVATKLKLALRDYGSCGRRPRDAGGLYVSRSAASARRAAAAGSTRSAAAPGARAPPSGRAVRHRQADPRRPADNVVLVRAGQSGGCQRTLEVRPDRTSAAPGEALRVTVRGYDDQGRGVPVAGASVRLRLGDRAHRRRRRGGADRPGGERPPAPPAERDGMVRAFPREVAVG